MVYFQRCFMAVSANPSKSMDSLGDTINPMLFLVFLSLSPRSPWWSVASLHPHYCHHNLIYNRHSFIILAILTATKLSTFHVFRSTSVSIIVLCQDSVWKFAEERLPNLKFLQFCTFLSLCIFCKAKAVQIHGFVHSYNFVHLHVSTNLYILEYLQVCTLGSRVYVQVCTFSHLKSSTSKNFYKSVHLHW